MVIVFPTVVKGACGRREKKRNKAGRILQNEDVKKNA